jgi:hypothetical protein
MSILLKITVFILASHKSHKPLTKRFLEIRRSTEALQTSKLKGAHPPSGTPLMYLFDFVCLFVSFYAFFQQYFSHIGW